MFEHFYAHPDGSHVNTARSNIVRTPENSGPVHSSAVSIQSNNNTFRQRWQTQNTSIRAGEGAGEPLIISPIIGQETAPTEEDQTPPPLPPRNPDRRVKQKQYSDFEYGTMCFLALCTFLGALGLVIALVVGALGILSRMIRF